MAKCEFVLSSELTPQIYHYLHEASEALNLYFTVEMAVAKANSGDGAIYHWFLDCQCLGAMFLDFRIELIDNKPCKTMNLILLGGTKINLWAEDLKIFLYDLANNLTIDEFTVLGRKGWGRMFSNLEHIACLYRVKLTNVNN